MPPKFPAVRLPYGDLLTKGAADLVPDAAGGEDYPAFGSHMRGWQWKVLQKQEAEAQRAWLPRVFRTDATPLTELLASPTRQGLLGGLAGGGAGAALGGLAGSLAGQTGAGAALGAGLGALAGGVGAYGHRRRENDRVVDALRRTPPGATVADYLDVQRGDAARAAEEAQATKQALSPYVKAPAAALGTGAGLLGLGHLAAPGIGRRLGTAAGEGVVSQVQPAIQEGQAQLQSAFDQGRTDLVAERDKSLQMVDQRLDRAEHLPQRMIGNLFGGMFHRAPAAPDGAAPAPAGPRAGTATGATLAGSLAGAALPIGLGMGAGALAGGLLGGHRTDVDAQGRPVRKRRLWPILLGAGVGGVGAHLGARAVGNAVLGPRPEA